MKKKKKLLAYLPHHIKPYGIGYAAHSIAIGMNSNFLSSDILSLKSDYSETTTHVKEVFRHDYLYKLAIKFRGEAKLLSASEKCLRNMSKKYDIIHLWPGCSLETIRYLKNSGKTIIIENINCHHQTSIQILNTEYKRIGLDDKYNVPNEKLSDEKAKLELADYVFSPSPQVKNSLINAGISEERILDSSYGLAASDLVLYDSLKDKHKKNTFIALFVGSVIPRKGVHLLLDYWRTAGIDGKLKIIGKIDSSFTHLMEEYDTDPSIEFISFTNDLRSHYENADIFIMPSLEEGSPLVSYLAVGAGLPCLVSPMAGEGIIREGIDGYIVDPYLKNEWVNKLKTLFTDKLLREKFSTSARTRAEDFLWEKVAKSRSDSILSKFME